MCLLCLLLFVSAVVYCVMFGFVRVCWCVFLCLFWFCRVVRCSPPVFVWFVLLACLRLLCFLLLFVFAFCAFVLLYDLVLFST